MDKSPDAFRTISEVADWLGIPTHVLRFWESRFAQVKPVKRAGGRRYYRPRDMELLGGIRKLLHDDGMTIRGVQKLLREEGLRHVSEMSPPLPGEDSARADGTLQAPPGGEVIEATATEAPPRASAPEAARETPPEAAPEAPPETPPETAPDAPALSPAPPSQPAQPAAATEAPPPAEASPANAASADAAPADPAAPAETPAETPDDDAPMAVDVEPEAPENVVPLKPAEPAGETTTAPPADPAPDQAPAAAHPPQAQPPEGGDAPRYGPRGDLLDDAAAQAPADEPPVTGYRAARTLAGEQPPRMGALIPEDPPSDDTDESAPPAAPLITGALRRAARAPAGARPDPAALRPLHDKLVALRERMDAQPAGSGSDT